MSKYIIELKDDVQVVQKVGVTENGNAFVMNFYKDQLEELTADYINEHFSDLQDTAYQRGLEDAWEAAKKLFSSMADSDIDKAFPIEWNNGGFNALMNLQPQEAIEKLKAYEEKQKAADEIKVGDEVTDIQSGANFLVTHLWESNHGDKGVSGFNNDCSAFSATLDEISKTGRHFDIQKILEDMRHD